MGKLNKCKDCGNMVSKSAKACPKCGAKQTTNAWWLLFLLFGAVIFMMYISRADDSGSSPIAHSKSLAYTLCKDAVKKNLKSPSSAIFPSLSNLPDEIFYKNIKGNDSYSVIGYVESENSFGASIKANFDCVIVFNYDTYSIIKLDLE